MIQFLFDTDHLTLFEHGHAAVGSKMAHQPPGAVGLSVTTVEEALRGRLGALSQARDGVQRIARYALLQSTVQLVNQFPVAVYDQAAEAQFQQLKALRLRVGSQDLKMAAIALVNGLTLLARNRQDFTGIPGRLLDDWSV
jgi:tRNA(fMet)-specific endonuclease VapC